jgi:hypothetical protein
MSLINFFMVSFSDDLISEYGNERSGGKSLDIKQKLQEMLIQNQSSASFDAQSLMRHDKNNNPSKPEMHDSATGSLSDELLISVSDISLPDDNDVKDELIDSITSNQSQLTIDSNNSTKSEDASELTVKDDLLIEIESESKPTKVAVKPVEKTATIESNETQSVPIKVDTIDAVPQTSSTSGTTTELDSTAKEVTIESASTSDPEITPESESQIRSQSPKSINEAQLKSDAIDVKKSSSSIESRSRSSTGSSISIAGDLDAQNKSDREPSDGSLSFQSIGRSVGVKKSISSRNLAESAGQLFARGISRSQSSNLLNKTFSTISSNLTSIASKGAGKSLITRTKKKSPSCSVKSAGPTRSMTTSSIADLILVTNEEDEDELGACDHEPGLEFDDSELQPQRLEKGTSALSSLSHYFTIHTPSALNLLPISIQLSHDKLDIGTIPLVPFNVDLFRVVIWLF